MTDPAVIPFNRPFIAGKELHYIAEAVTQASIAGDGAFTKRCARLLEQRFGVRKVLLTPSCTAALEIAAQLLDLEPGDEVILPSFTFVSTANAFLRTGARPVFVDIREDTLNLDERRIEEAMTPRTRAIVPVHYAGVACDMRAILALAERRGVVVVEDAAQGVDAYLEDRALGSWAPLGAWSFHETKNFTCGEGGALCINDPRWIQRAEILREKGTDRSRFLRGEVDKYTWLEIGSSHVPSEIASAFLYGQLEHLDSITRRRALLHARYGELLGPLHDRGLLVIPVVPADRRSNAHMFHVLLRTGAERDGLLAHLRERGIRAAFHYVPLHDSPRGRMYGAPPGGLPVTESVSARLLRLPFFHDMTEEQQVRVATEVATFLDPASAPRRGAVVAP